METTASEVAATIGARGPIISTAVDRETLWAWIPLGEHPPASTPAHCAPPWICRSRDTSPSGSRGWTAGLSPDARTGHRRLRGGDDATRLARERRRIRDRGSHSPSLLAVNLDSTGHGSAGARQPADDTENAAVLRQTMRTFYATGESHLHTAEQLNLHRNTVKYRVDKALASTRSHDRPISPWHCRSASSSVRPYCARDLTGASGRPVSVPSAGRTPAVR